MTTLAVGDIVANKFRVISTLGRGTYGEVVSAQAIGSNELVAIKKISFDLVNESVFIAFREISILRSIEHPNIISLSRVITPKPCDYILLVTELFEDGDLRKFVKSKFPDRKVSSCMIFEILDQLVNAVAYLHDHHILHRDIKLQNILVRETEHGVFIKLADFGLAKNVMKRKFATRHVPMTHEIVTLWYRAPEVLLCCDAYDEGVDLWSIGVVLVEMFSGSNPFNGRSEFETLMKIFKLIETPRIETWPELEMMEFYSDKFPQWFGDHRYERIVKLAPERPEWMHKLAMDLLEINPRNRVSAKNVLIRLNLILSNPKRMRSLR
jgi:cyclin-dependent kinase